MDLLLNSHIHPIKLSWILKMIFGIYVRFRGCKWFIVIHIKNWLSPKEKARRWTWSLLRRRPHSHSSRLDNIVAWEDFQTWASSAISGLHHYRPTGREGVTVRMLEGQRGNTAVWQEKSTWKIIKVIKCNQQASFWTWQSVLFQDVLAIAIPR